MTGFRPLIGVNFCKHSEMVKLYEDASRVSVPLSGLVSVNVDVHRWHHSWICSFRPLIGVNFCKQDWDEELTKVMGPSFRPLIGVSSCKL